MTLKVVKMPGDLMEERAFAMTVMHILRNPDLRVQRARESCVDLWVTVLRAGRPTEHRFGLKVSALMTPDELRSRISSRSSALAPARSRLQAVESPLCLVVCTMTDSNVAWRWLKRPVTVGNRSVALEWEGDTTLRQLDVDALSEIVDAVKSWYKALAAA